MEDDYRTLEAAIELRRALTRVSRRLRSEVREADLSGAKHSILGHLYRDGAMTPSALAQADGVQPQSLTRLLANLEESGLARKQPDEADRRQVKFEITSAGARMLERDAGRRAFWLAKAMRLSLSSTEQEFLRLAAQLLERVAAVPKDVPEDSVERVPKDISKEEGSLV